MKSKSQNIEALNTKNWLSLEEWSELYYNDKNIKQICEATLQKASIEYAVKNKREASKTFFDNGKELERDGGAWASSDDGTIVFQNERTLKNQ